MKHLTLAAALLFIGAAPAAAYTSYVLPSEFYTMGESVTIQGSFATQIFTPEIALPPNITVTAPSGQTGQLDSVEVTANAVSATDQLVEVGTYRVSTGEIAGQVSTIVAVDGQWRSLPAGSTPPEGADTKTLQTITVSSAYVTRGAPSNQVIALPNGRLNIRPVTHPNQVLAAQGIDVDVLFDNAPWANGAVVLYAAGQPETARDKFFATDANGRVHIPLDAAGKYLLVVRHVADAPAGAASQVGSYTTTLAFEAFDALPAANANLQTEQQAAQEPSRRRTPARRRVGRPDL